MSILKVCALDGKFPEDEFQVPYDAQMTVKDLCDVIFSLTDIPPERVALYQSGRVMAIGGGPTASKLLSQSGISCGSVVRFVEVSGNVCNSVSNGCGAAHATSSSSSSFSLSSASSLLPRREAQVAADNKAIEEALRRVVREPVGGEDADSHAFVRRLWTYWRQAIEMEAEDRQAVARNAMPVQQLRSLASGRVILERERPGMKELALTKELLHWFKREFFTWVDVPPCETCALLRTEFLRLEPPSREEAVYQASRTEVYECGFCHDLVRFPRFEDAVHLVSTTRRGRCGEWAKAFALCARALGLRVRLVHDWTDHVWAEIWIPDTPASSRSQTKPNEESGRWVHADPCEDVMDEPLLYETGWGKQLTYCIATGAHGVIDVTPRYTKQFDEVCKRRTLIREGALASALVAINVLATKDLTPEEHAAARKRWAADVENIAAASKGPANAYVSEVRGRQSGSAAWVAARGEDGSRR